MKIKKGDFVKLEYTGKVKETDEVFDTTSKEEALKHKIYDKDGVYGTLTICIGKNQILKGLEDALIGKEAGKKYKIELDAEHAFGKKDAKLLKLIATSKFVKQGVKPFPGLSVNIDGLIGTIRAVTGGRTIVDFNHPLAGKDIIYEVNIIEIVQDLKEKINGFLKFELPNIKFDIKLDDKTLTLNLPKDFPVKDKLKQKIKEFFPEIKDVKI